MCTHFQSNDCAMNDRAEQAMQLSLFVFVSNLVGMRGGLSGGDGEGSFQGKVGASFTAEGGFTVDRGRGIVPIMPHGLTQPHGARK